jgi:TPR repeat protein
MKALTVRYLLKFIATLVAAVWMVVGAVAGPYEDGKAAYDRKDYSTALKLWRPLAEQGDARGQSSLGYMYSTGKGVPKDHAEAVKWYRKAAEQGDAKAQSNLGLMYDKGQGVPRDDGLAQSRATIIRARDAA